ncbi:TolB family protein [Oscillatoria acuminata]|uniref:Periplasmic component of the Tol biopolymer transport system n=1 Tax=Oscillatoria acuminata PCC 6304 TaxID=56110 RepID=K9TNB9_9CYAN|nr:PD40 domain-containing protein [Oscillatoria acuminata]AFY84332.1 periplasmic component of the Tol biopolymer transport system [Oscillatoria acuminata PCC 6304]
MLLPKNLPIATCYLLLGLTGLSLAGCQNFGLGSSGDLRVDQPVRLIAEADREAVFVSLPSPRRNPNQDFSAEVLEIDLNGKKRRIEATRKQIKYPDSVTGESSLLHLLGFNWAGTQRWIPDPQHPSPQFWPNPQDPSVLLFQPQSNLGGLYLLDTDTLDVKAIGNHQALRETIAKTRALPPTPPPPNCKESECEAGVRILYWASDPNWSPDGRMIVFTSNRETLGATSDMSIWVLDVATGQATKTLGNPGDRYRIFGWSAQGEILAWEYSELPNSLVAISPSTGDKEVLLQGQYLEFLALSDDYKTLLYASRPSGENSTSSFAKLYAFSPDTRESQLLFEETPIERLSSIRPDFSEQSDRVVAVLSDVQGGHTLWVYDLPEQISQRVSLPQGKRLFATERKLEWAGDRLVVPLEDVQTQTFSTLLMAVDL